MKDGDSQDRDLVSTLRPGGGKLHWFYRPEPRSACLRKAVVTCMLLCFALAVAGTAQAQSTTSLRGTVTDPSGSVVSGATVVVSDPQSKVERTVQTGSQGEYQFQFLPPGTYIITVSAPGLRVISSQGCSC